MLFTCLENRKLQGVGTLEFLLSVELWRQMQRPKAMHANGMQTTCKLHTNCMQTTHKTDCDQCRVRPTPSPQVCDSCYKPVLRLKGLKFLCISDGPKVRLMLPVTSWKSPRHPGLSPPAPPLVIVIQVKHSCSSPLFHPF